MELIADGSTITGKLNGTTVLGPSTDPTPELLTTFTGGVFMLASALGNATFDLHTIADVVAAGAPLPLFHRHYAGMRAA